MFTNRLINEDSPYLKQHAHNPVDWYPWSKEAFKKAKKEDKPIFLSIGYSTCHWCHVMERESFENEEIAEVLNENFVSIKVDREEMPQVDKYYQDVFYVMRKRGGGWPLSVVMTPDKEVFYIDTYLPPFDRYGRPGLKRILLYLLDLYKNRKDDVLKSARSVDEAMKRIESSKIGFRESVNEEILKLYTDRIESSFDKVYKGIGSAPKFPHASNWNFLLDVYKINRDKRALNMAFETLKAMAKGGIYDQIEGGFYRYSVDERWLIPHFEKMLYTNAELIETYAKAYEITKDELFKEVVEDSIKNIFERFRKENLFFSASDADSDGEEGKYFLFLYEDALRELIEGGFEKKEAKRVLKYFGITMMGNFENYLSNPHITDIEISKESIIKAKEILRKNREKRNYPFIDYKILTSWNALMIKALFEAGRFVNESYFEEALKSLDALVANLYKEGVLYHQFIFEKPLKIKAVLEDYAFLIDSLIEGYQYSLDTKYLDLAYRFAKEAKNKFYEDGVWYLSDDEFKTVAPLEDSSYKSAAALMIENCLVLGALRGDLEFYNDAKESLSLNAKFLNRYPSAYPTLLRAFVADKEKIVVVKSTKDNLSKLKNLKSFIYKSVSDDDKYLLCHMNSCFFYSSSLEEIENKLENI